MTYNKIGSELGSSKSAKANLVDDPYNEIQLQTELEIYFFIKSISSYGKVDNL